MTDGGDTRRGPGDGAAEVLDRPLPDGVRRRVVQIVSDGFGSLTLGELPAQLRQYARFAPNRRIKFAGNAMAAAVETDPLFRQRIGEKFRDVQSELADALDAGSALPAADPLDVAAAAYVLRPHGWVKLVTAAGEEAQRADAERADEESRAELERLHEGCPGPGSTPGPRPSGCAASWTRRSGRPSRCTASCAPPSATSSAARRRCARSRPSWTPYGPRGRPRCPRPRARPGGSRPAWGGRGGPGGHPQGRPRGRSVEDMRVRLLLDTLLDATQGLRRELALPPVSVRPAETVDAVEPGRMTPKDIANRALSENDPAILDQLLALPQAHLVVDGYNVTKTGYPQMPLEKQRLRLLGQLSQLAAQTGAEMTCVFDGAELVAPVLLAPPRGVRVLFSKPGVTADELIRQLVRAEPPGRPVIVVSTDREVADGVARAGARPVASVVLLKRLS